MKNTKFIYSVTSLIILIFFSSNLLAYRWSVAQDVQISYDDCTGEIIIKTTAKYDEGTDDFFGNLHIEITEDGVESSLFLMVYEAQIGPNLFVDNSQYSYTTFGRNVVVSTLPKEGQRWPIEIRIRDASNSFFGQKITVNIEGEWFDRGNSAPNILFNQPIETPNNTMAIGAPVISTASTDECGQVTLNWSNPSNVETSCNNPNWYLQILRNDALWVNNISKTTTSTTITGLGHGDVADYKVRAVWLTPHNRQSISTSEPKTGITYNENAPPSNILATTDRCDGKILISWVPPAYQVTDYLIKRNGSAFSHRTTNTQYLDTPPNTNTNYTYTVQARNKCNVDGTVGTSNVGYAEGPPLAPSNVTASIQNNAIKIDWIDNSNTETGFIIERTTPGGGSPLVINVGANTSSYSDSDITQCVTYTYRVKSISTCFADGQGNDTASKLIGPDLSNTFDPLKFKASTGFYTNRVQLTWEQNPNSIINKIKIGRRVLGSGEDFVQIASENPGTALFNDLTADAGVIYEYRLFAESLCENTTILSNSVYSVGFRTRSGQVNGKVSYTGGNAVKGVKIIAEKTTSTQSKVLRLSGTGSNISIPVDSSQDLNNELLIETWLKPDGDAIVQSFGIIEKNNSYNLLYNHSVSEFHFEIKYNGGSSKLISMPLSDVTLNNWNHIGAQIRDDSIFIIANGIVINKDVIPNFSTIDNPNSGLIQIGNNFKGLIKEARLWKKGKTEASLMNDYSRFMVGLEVDLFILLPLTEGVGTYGYDRSKDGQSFNRNHGLISQGTWSNEAPPTENQLGFAGYTDIEGNYILTLPFSGSGENYTLTPSFGTHVFDPSTRLLFIGEGATVINNMDFEDISSFRVTGTLLFDGTNCPSKDVFIKVDGQNIIQNGLPVITDSDGNFDMQVPIGQHVLTLEKNGHEFSAGRFPISGTFDFQENVTGIEFKDSTLRKVVGRVVGGQREGDKLPGLGLSKNNIGVANLTIDPLSTCGWIVGTNGIIQDDTLIHTDPVTGEYSIDLPPLNYTVSADVENNNDVDFQGLEVLELTNLPFTQEAVDTQRVNGVQIINSITFHKQFDFIHRENPSLDVQNKNGDGPFVGETSHVFTHSKYGSDTLNVEDFLYPVFLQGQTYEALISTFESYTNYDGGPGNEVEDRVPVTDGVITINNDLSPNGVLTIDLSQAESYDGDTLYIFKGGHPNTTENTQIPPYSFTEEFKVDLAVGTQNAKWEPLSNPAPLGNYFFRGYILGTNDVEESDFVLQGPQMVDYILRDPPGSQSSATREIGVATTNEYSWEWNVSGGFDMNNNLYAGVKFLSGFGFITETETSASLALGITLEAGGGNGKTVTETITSNESWSTSAEPLLAGHHSDLFIGTSRNYLFGVATSLILVPENICDSLNSTITCYGSAVNGKQLAIEKTLAIAQGDVTSEFFITQNKIETDEIPDLKGLRNQHMSNDSRYVSKLGPEHPCFGVNNDDPRLGTSACPNTSPGSLNPDTYERDEDDDGPSYRFVRNAVEEIDSVRIFNQQIRLWKDAIALNEKQKLEAVDTSTRIAFGGGGSSFTRTVTNTKSTTTTNNIEFQFDESLGFVIGFEVGGIGFEDTYTVTMSQSRTQSKSKTVENSHTISYTLSDDSEWDDFLVNVQEGSNTGGPIFKTLGGRSSCPHEGQVISKYYQPGEVLSPGSIQLEHPELIISPTILTNIPQDEAGIFTARLRNNNQVGEGWEYSLSLLNHTNPGGAIIVNSGTSELGSIFNINPGQEIQQRIIVEAGGAYQHDSLLFVLHSTCQYQQGLSSERDIADSAYFSISFIPGCTEIQLVEPEKQFVLNNSFENVMEIKAEDYNVNYFNFDHLNFQYKPSSQNDWVNLETYYYDTTGMNVPEAKMIDRQKSFTLFEWDVSQLPDGPYDLRATTDCSVATFEADKNSGYFDRIDPHAFGTPSPADGILNPDDDISIKFNEIVDLGTISDFNFDVRGVLNGSDLRHQESLAFDGVNDYAEIEEYNLSKRSFTIEYWAKRNGLGKQIVFSQGLNQSHQMNLGFDHDNRAYFELGDKVIKSENSIVDTDNWYHYTFVYDRENNSAAVFVNSNQAGQDIHTSNVFTSDFTGAGKMYLGKSSAGSPFSFDGFIHELRLWSKVRSIGEVTSQFDKSLSSREIGLIGNWPMDEAWGTIAKDKVRGRHANLFGASWSILPKGNAYHFDENQEFLRSDSAGTLAFSKQTNLTFEFWFKGQNSGQKMSVLSNGIADGTGTNQGAWDIYFNASGNLVVENDGSQVSTSGDHLDNNWHHFSSVVNRLGNISLYIDGQLVTSELATEFKDFVGPKLWIGARGYFNGTIEMTDHHFRGYLDDVRVWNLARTSEQINRDFVNALSGDELGLEAYYPFDNFEVQMGVPILTPTLLDKSMSEFEYDLVINKESSFSQQTAPIKLARPVKKVNYTYSVNQDEIIISLNDDPALIENVTLDITVSGIRDLAGNFMRAPRTWIAYIDKNQVFWNEENMEFEKMEGDPLSFEANVRNSGGASQSYVIGNLPEWLSASPSAGVIDPNSSLKITFTVDPLMDIGEFTQDIYVTGDFGFNEKLIIDLKNNATPPEWEVNHGAFSHHMNITGILKINDVISIDEDDMVAAFINDNLAGVSPVKYFEEQSLGLVFMTISMNNPNNDPIVFRVWDASEGREISDVLPDNLIFINGNVLGDASNPVEFNARALTRLTYHLSPGWNWISFPNNGSVLSNVSALFDGLDLQQNDDISGPTDNLYDRVNSNGDWLGLFSGAQVEYGYKMYVKNGGTFTYDGIFENPDQHVIDISTDWTWIGMIAEQNMDISTALASLDPQNGDIIKNLSEFAVYNNLFGWVGNLTTLSPQEGYQIKLQSPDQLIYPSSLSSSFAPLAASSSQQQVFAQQNHRVVNKLLDFDKNIFPFNMNMIAHIDSCHLSESFDIWYLVALSDGHTRGVAPVQYDANMDGFTAYLTIHGFGDESLNFTLVKGDMSQQNVLIETETFVNNSLLGNPESPYHFGCLSNDPDCPTVRDVSPVDLQVTKAQTNYRAAIRLSSSAIISGQKSVEFSAGREVILNHGFEVMPESSVLINIENCPD